MTRYQRGIDQRDCREPSGRSRYACVPVFGSVMRQKTLELEHTVIGDGARRGASASPITGQRPRRISAEKGGTILGALIGLMLTDARLPDRFGRGSSGAVDN